MPDASSQPQTHAITRVPRWATALDVAAVGALIVSLVTALGGGFRFSVSGLRLTAASPLRPLIAALVIIAIRHAIIRRQPLPRRCAALWRRLETVDGWSAAWRPFVTTRAAVLAVGLLAVYTVGYPPEAPPYRVSRSEVVNLPMRWDAGWYMGIANGGYRWDPSRAGEQQNIVFFPAYPLLTRLVARLFVFAGSIPSLLLAGVLISHATFLWGLLYLFQLAREQFGDAPAAARTVLLLAAYPFSVFYGAAYTESLFMLGCLGAVLHFCRDRPLRSAPWGILAGLSRPNGFLLSATLLAFAYARTEWVPGTWRTRATWLRLFATVAPMIGPALFSLYIGALTGNPLQWSAQQAAWGRAYRGASPFFESAIFVGHYGFESAIAQLPYTFLNTIAAAVALILIVPVWRRLGPPYAVFLAVNLVPPLVLGGVTSMGRFTSTMFPLFILLGLRTTTASLPFWAVAFAVGQSLAAVLFYTWRPLY